MNRGGMSEVADASSTQTSAVKTFALGTWPKLALLAINALPLLHVALLTVVLMQGSASRLVRFSLGVSLLYLLPPLLARTAMICWPIRRQTIAVGSRDFFVWWFTVNAQVLFARVPLLEEILRLVPALYSLWLRLWGSKIGKLTYWAPGVAVLDRSFLRIGDNVTFGAGVRLNGHVLRRDELGNTVLVLAPIRIGDDVLVGGYALLTAGVDIAPRQTTRACLLLPPFSRIVNGRRVKDVADFPESKDHQYNPPAL